MKMTRKRLVLTLASLTGGIGLGLLISFLVFMLDQPDEDTSSPSNTPSRSTANTEDTEEIASPTLGLVDIIELTFATERRHALYKLLDKSIDQQIVDVLERTFSMDQTNNVYLVQKILIAELARLDPEKALAFIWQIERPLWGSLLDEVATHWSLIAPKDALSAFASLKEPWKRRAIQTVFKSQGSLTETELAEISESLDINDHFLLWTHEVALAEVLDEPRQAFKLTLNADISNLDKQRLVLQTTNRWLERVGTADIGAKLNLVYDVFPDVTNSLTRFVVAEIAKFNPAFVWEQLNEMSQEVRQRFSGTVFSVWVESDLDATLQVITNKNHLTHTEWSLDSFLYTWVRAVSENFLEHVEQIPETDRIRAIQIAVDYLAQSSPPHEVLDLLTQLRSRGHNTLEATDSFVQEWSRKDPLTAVEWVIENLEQGRSNGQIMLGWAVEQLALSDPKRAMKIALEQPSEFQLERRVVGELLRQGEFDTALSFAPQVRESPWYGSIYSTVSYFLIREGRTEDALALAIRVEESERPKFYRDLVSPWLNNDADSLLEDLPKLPTSEIRSVIAAEVLRSQERSQFLTEKELEFVRTFISDDPN